jgi:hypothetical protein
MTEGASISKFPTLFEKKAVRRNPTMYKLDISGMCMGSKRLQKTPEIQAVYLIQVIRRQVMFGLKIRGKLLVG